MNVKIISLMRLFIFNKAMLKVFDVITLKKKKHSYVVEDDYYIMWEFHQKY